MITQFENDKKKTIILTFNNNKNWTTDACTDKMETYRAMQLTNYNPIRDDMLLSREKCANGKDWVALSCL